MLVHRPDIKPIPLRVLSSSSPNPFGSVRQPWLELPKVLEIKSGRNNGVNVSWQSWWFCEDRPVDKKHHPCIVQRYRIGSWDIFHTWLWLRLSSWNHLVSTMPANSRFFPCFFTSLNPWSFMIHDHPVVTITYQDRCIHVTIIMFHLCLSVWPRAQRGQRSTACVLGLSIVSTVIIMHLGLYGAPRKYPCQYHCGVVHSHRMVPCIHLARIETTSSLNLVRVRSLSLNFNLSLYIVICQRSLRSCFPSRGEAPEEPVTPAAAPYESACSAHVACPKFDGWTWGIGVPLLLPSFHGVWNERKKTTSGMPWPWLWCFFSFFLRGFHPHQVAQPQAQCAGQQGECCPTDTGILMGCCHLT